MADTTIRPIRSEKDYKATLARIDEIIDAPYGTPAADELQILGTLIAVYEDERYPIAPPDPVEAILVRAGELGKTRKDLAAIMGGRSRVSEVLNRRRRLSLQMIRQLARELKMPADILVQPYKLARQRPNTRKGHRA